MRYVLVLLSLVLSIQVLACMNMVQRVPGVEYEHTEFYWIGQTTVDVDSVRTYLRLHEQALVSKGGREANDIVIAHLYLKEFPQALSISTKLVAKHPNDYSVVITHAAALELNGRIADAIPFMKQALAINPKSHNGSEWIHLNILEQRLKGGPYILPWELIGVDLRPDSAVVAPRNLDVKALVKQVHFQVVDRIFFTPKHDPLFGALMFAYADLLELMGHKSSAKQVRRDAEGYGFIYQRSPSPIIHPDGSAAPRDSILPGKPGNTPAQPSYPTQKSSGIATWMVSGLIAAIVGFIVFFIWRTARQA